MATLFERLGRPAPTEKARKPKPEPEPEQLLLTWLQRWNKPVVSTRDIRIYGPRPLRDREIATSSLEVLIRHGWLVPAETRQRGWRHWQIVRKGPIVPPAVANVAAK